MTSFDLPTTDPEWAALVNDAFKAYTDLVALAASPLAHSTLIQPALVLDPSAPTPDERGRALRILLQWSVEQLAPAPPRFPLGTFRPFDDPTWSDPLWWEYNLLRHRYLEPLRPDERDALAASGYATALMNLLGLRDEATFYELRKAAISSVARLLWQESRTRRGAEVLAHLAAAAYCDPLLSHPAPRALLDAAATFDEPVPPSWLLAVAATLQAGEFPPALSTLVNRRLLQPVSGEERLLLPNALRPYLQQRQAPPEKLHSHRAVSRCYLPAHPVQAAWHLFQAEEREAALTLVVAQGPTPFDPQARACLLKLWGALRVEGIPAALWGSFQLRCSDEFRLHHPHEAEEACRRGLEQVTAPGARAPFYRRLGKLHEDRNHLLALFYYQRAIELFDESDPGLVETLKDRAWLYLLLAERDETPNEWWGKAQGDLQRALALVHLHALDQQADIHDAFNALYRKRQCYEEAIHHAHLALALREEIGDRLHVAYSYNNLARTYRAAKKWDAARATYQAAERLFQALGSQAELATVYLNLGALDYFEQQYSAAIAHYLKSLSIFHALPLPRGEAQAHYNLAEAYLALGERVLAGSHWHQGYRLCQQQDGLDEQLQWFESLATDHPALREFPPETPPPPIVEATPPLNSREQDVITYARAKGMLIVRDVMERLSLSKASATRLLKGLTDKGLLIRQGSGPATRYVPAGK